MEVTKPSHVLVAAAEAIVSGGWCQESYASFARFFGPPAYCVLGAINVASGVPFDRSISWPGDAESIRGQAIEALMGAIGGSAAVGAYAIGRWNDRYDRTEDEVIATLLGVAAELAAAGK